MGLIVLVGIALAAYRNLVFRAALIPVAIAIVIALFVLSGCRIRITAWRVVGFVVGALALPFLGATVLSQGIWGYPFERPGLDHRIVDARRIDSVTLVETLPDGKGVMEFVAQPVSWPKYRGTYLGGDPYYTLGGRILIATHLRGSLPDNPKPMPPGEMARLHPLLDRTGHLEIGEPDYEDRAKTLRGVVVEATKADGGRLLFVGVNAGEVSNDHHPYYEFLFAGTVRDPSPRLLSFQRFYYDVAGIEGMEWPAFFMAFSTIGLPLATPIAVAMLLVRRRCLKRRIASVADGRETL